MPRLNRVDPFGDLHRVPHRGMFTGNRGCLVDDAGQVVRHHSGTLWITCVTTYKDWRSPLDQPRHWTPLFFLDDAVALAAGHRPCGLCRRDDYRAYRAAVQAGWGVDSAPTSTDLNATLAAERLDRGRGLARAQDRRLWRERIDRLPPGSVVRDDDGTAKLLTEKAMFAFDFAGWVEIGRRPRTGEVSVLTPPTSVLALAHGYEPALHPSASRST